MTKQKPLSSGVPNWKNRTLFHGDNLKFLRAMNSESVHLIATDPPFNKGRDFHAAPDSPASGASFQDRWSWEKDVREEWTDKTREDFPELMKAVESAKYAHSEAMGDYICFMAVRLLEMKRILREDGSIYLHCDPTASHYLKAAMDAVFGGRNFRNEIVWRRDDTIREAKKKSRQWPKAHDRILFYTKSKKWEFHLLAKQLTEEQVRRYRHDDNGRRYRTSHLGDYSEKSVEELRKQGLIHVSRNGVESKKYFLDEVRGTPYSDVWTDIQAFGVRSRSHEITGHPAQKPLDLYERIIRASSSEGDVVLDPFCGCATTCVAAERCGRQWVGIDIWDEAHPAVIERLKKEGCLEEPDGGKCGSWFAEGKITYSKEPPERTDTVGKGGKAVPFPEAKLKIDEPKGPGMPRDEVAEHLS